jgi:hemin uptake protein HemP
MNQHLAPDKPPMPSPPPSPIPERLSSERLFDGRRELIIVHQGGEYRLRITRQGKLILTK